MLENRRIRRRDRNKPKKEVLEKHYNRDNLTIEQRQQRLRVSFGPRFFLRGLNV